MTRFFEHVLTPHQFEVLSDLAPAVAGFGFYLAGGTAVALHLGHRRSNDFGWFVGQFPHPPIDVASSIRSAVPGFAVDEIEEGTVIGTVRGVKTSLLAFPYPRLAPLLDWRDRGVRVADLRDLATMKLLAVVQRGTKRDFVDLHALLDHGQRLPDLLTDFGARFGVTDPVSVLRAIVYFEDAQSDPMPEMLTSVTWDAVRNRLEREVERLA
jgi:hypothetical protein